MRRKPLSGPAILAAVAADPKAAEFFRFLAARAHERGEDPMDETNRAALMEALMRAPGSRAYLIRNGHVAAAAKED